MYKLSDLLKDFYKIFAGLGIYIMPGAVVLETVFDIGLFGQKITTTFDLVLYIFWALLLGLPFHFIHFKEFYQFLREIKNRLNHTYNEFDELSDELELGYVYIKVFTFYIVYKFITWQNIIKLKSWFNLKDNITNYIIAVILTFLFEPILIYVYKILFKNNS